MAKGRHRKPERTALPAGATAVTGKARSAQKNQTFAWPLPLDVPAPSDYHAAIAAASSAQSWSAYLASFLPGFVRAGPSKKTMQLPKVVGYWDATSRSVWLRITPAQDEEGGKTAAGSNQAAAVRLLWERGFFGKGTLSRSEPTWRDRQVNALRVQRERQRGVNVYTPEELTALRRKERKAAKIARARLAVRAGQQLADGITALGGTLTEEEERELEILAEREMAQEDDAAGGEESGYGKHIPGLIYLKPQEGLAKTVTPEAPMVSEAGMPGALQDAEDEEAPIEVEDMESLQLSPFEVLFLSAMLGVLEVRDSEDVIIPLESLYALLLATALPYQYVPSALLGRPSDAQLSGTAALWQRPDNPFLLHYVAYHHFRSLGWVVKNGIKFCIDFLLYKRGPVFSHAEFAVLVLPEYEDPEDAKSSPFATQPNDGDKGWVWFSTMNRVNTQVLKTLVLCYVSIPALSRFDKASLATPQGFVDGLRSGQSFTVREVAIRRWVPARMRA